MDKVSELYKRIDEEVSSLALRNRLYTELRYAREASSNEAYVYYVNRVENTLDTLDTD